MIPGTTIPFQLTFRDMPPSAAVQAAVEAHASKLAPFADKITHCHVAIESPHRHHQHGRIFHVHIDLGAVGGTVAAAREPGRDHAHEDVYIAIRDAFRAVRRQLTERVQRLRHEVKQHSLAQR